MVFKLVKNIRLTSKGRVNYNRYNSVIRIDLKELSDKITVRNIKKCYDKEEYADI